MFTYVNRVEMEVLYLHIFINVCLVYEYIVLLSE